MSPTPNYWDYLKLDRLLDLQGGLEDDETQLMPDELHFIVVHQVFELWFKLCLRQLRLARDHLAAPKVPEERIPYVVHHLRRVGEIFRLAVDQFGVMETLTPQDFLGFRDKLMPASGFQSFQMRELEILLGLDDRQREIYAGTHPLKHIEELAADSPGGDLAVSRVKAAREEQTLRSAMHEWLYRTPIHGSGPDDEGDEAVVREFLEAYLAALAVSQQGQLERLSASGVVDADQLQARFQQSHRQAREFLFPGEGGGGASGDHRPGAPSGNSDSDPDSEDGDADRLRRIRAGLLFIESYRELPLLAWPRLLVDTVVEVEEQMVLWRGRHARMVERTIGRRVGTGGSSGVEYLDATAKYRIFPELWAVRTLLLPKESLPELKNAEAYGFAQ